MYTATLASMRAEAAADANIPTPTTTTAITISMANTWLNRGVNKLFRLALQGGGETVYRKEQTITTSTGVTKYALPLDLYELKSVEYLLDSSGLGDRITLERFELSQRPYLLSATPGWNGEPFKYAVVGKSAQDGSDPGAIELLPPPSFAAKVNLIYVFGPKALVNDLDAFDGFAGFDEYAVKYMVKEVFLRQNQRERATQMDPILAAIAGDVVAGLRQRDAARAPRVNMTRELWKPRWTRFGRAT